MKEGKTLSAEDKQAIMAGTFKGEEGYDETKTEDTSKETKTDTATETKTEPEKKVEEKTEKTVEEKAKEEKVDESPFSLQSFNKKFEKEFESEDNLKSLFEKADKYDETKTSNDDLTQKLTEYQNLAEQLDPMSNFLNEDEYVRQQFLKKNVDNLGEDAIKALSVLSPSKVKELSDVDALKTQLMVDKNISSAEAETYLLNKYSIERFGDEDIEAGIKTTMKVDAIDARRDVSKLYDGIEIPQKVDWETSRQELKSSWDSPLSELKKGLDKISVADGVEINITESMLENVDVDSTLRELMSKQIAPSEAAMESIIGTWRDKIVINNMSQVAEAIANDAVEKNNAEWRKKVHNDKPLDETSRSEATEQTNDEKMRDML